MNQHLFNKVKNIAFSKTRNGVINHSAFDSINNRPTVITALKELGYKPNCETSPSRWSTESALKSAENPSANIKLIANNEDVEKAFIANLKSNPKIHNSARIAATEKLILGGSVYLEDSGLNKAQLVNVVFLLRKAGFEIETITHRKTKTLLGYRRIVVEEGDEGIFRESRCMPTKSGKEVLFILLKKGVFYMKDHRAGRDYLMDIVSVIKNMDEYNVENIYDTVDGKRMIVGYKLIQAQ